MASVELFGETFDLHPDGINPTALMFFAKDMGDAQEDEDAGEMQRAMMSLCLETVAEKDRRRYRKVMIANRADVDDHMKVIAAATEAAAERPTSLPADSSGGLKSTPRKSESVSERAERLKPGRPDLQAVLVRAQTA